MLRFKVNIFYGWWVVFACFLIAFYIGGTAVFGFTAFFEPIAQETGWSHTQISIAASFRGLEMGILAPIMGFLVDHFGPRRLVFCGTIITGFGLLLLSQANSLTMFYGAFILIALGTSACFSIVLTAAVANWFKRNMGRALGIMSCGFGAGGILIPVVVRLIDLYQWRTTLIILGLGMWLLGIPLSFVIRHRSEQYDSLLDGETSAEEVNFKEALKNRNFWHLTIAEIMRLMILMAVITHVMPYLSSLNISRSRAALVATLIPVLSIIGRLGFGWLGDIFDKRYVMAGAYSLAGVGVLAFSHAQTTWLIFPFLILFPLSWGAVVLRGVVIREYFGMASFGKLLGIMAGIAMIGGVMGPFLAGWTYDTLGSYHPIWLAFAGISIVPVILMLTMKPYNLEHAANLVQMDR